MSPWVSTTVSWEVVSVVVIGSCCCTRKYLRTAHGSASCPSPYFALRLVSAHTRNRRQTVFARTRTPQTTGGNAYPSWLVDSRCQTFESLGQPRGGCAAPQELSLSLLHTQLLLLVGMSFRQYERRVRLFVSNTRVSFRGQTSSLHVQSSTGSVVINATLPRRHCPRAQ